MTGVVQDPDPGQAIAEDGLLLTAVKVDFTRGRPKREIKLVMTWSGSVRCSRPSTIVVCIHHRRRLSRVLSSNEWKEVAFVQAPLASNLPPVSDSRHCMTVEFTVSAYTEELSHPDSVVQSTSAPSASLNLKAAKEKLEKQKVVLDKLEKVRSVIDVVKSVGQALSDIHPAIGAATSALGFLIEALKKQESCRDEALELVEQFEPFFLIESHMEALKQRVETQRAVRAMLKLIEETSEYILSHTSSSYIGNLLGDEYKNTLSKMKAEFSRAKEDFDRSIRLEVFQAVHDTERIAQLGFLHEKLSERDEAHFKSGEENTCLHGTREDLLQRTLDWINDSTDAQPGMFWLRGKAGSGKSTVANTVARTVEQCGYYLSCFFCRRDDQNLSSPTRLFPTLAYRFAQQHANYRAAIFQFLHNDTRGTGIATTADVDTQFDRLFKELLKKTLDPVQPHVVIIDALDECGSSRDQTRLAKCILQLSRLVPWVKVFVTSRDEPAISNALASSSCVQCNINEERGIDDDIRRYIISQAEELGFELSTEDVDQLVGRAEGLFIWCSTLFKYLRKRYLPRKALEPFLSGGERRGSWVQLYELYDRILDSAADEDEDTTFMRTVLAIVNVAANNRPLSANAVVAFLHDRELYTECSEVPRVEIVVKRLHAVLYVDQSMSAAIRAYHTSFYDFLEEKAKAASGWERLQKTHGRMFHNCIDVLDRQLRFNVCKIEVPILNRDIPDLRERISDNIPEELRYSSRFWFTHLSPSNLAEADALSGVSALLCSKKLLFWLESLSLQDSLSQSLLAFEECMRFFQGSPATITAASDARRFVTSFYEAMDSVSHIYLSSLFWLPENSETYRNLELSKWKHRPSIEHKRENWDLVVWERYMGQSLFSVAYSPNGLHVASGAENGLIYIWDARTGRMEGQPLHGHRHGVVSLAYSPDGCLIASGSGDSTVRIWNVKSGEPVLEPLLGHTDEVYCIAYAPNGQFLASGSEDATIRIWNVKTGVQENTPLRGHTEAVRAVAYSPDGLHIASGSEDCTVRIWNTVSHEEVGQALRGHSHMATTVAFSHDGQTIVSGSSNGTVRIWDMRTRQPIGQLLQAEWVRSVMYSPDNLSILTSSDDHTVRIWDAASCSPVVEPLRGHTGYVRSASYSPDGLFIASASDDSTLRIWDVPASSKVQALFQGHSKSVYAVAYSPGGHHIATGSADFSICLWDAKTGALVGEPLQGHEDLVLSLTFSPDGQCIASGSNDKTVRIWDVKTGKSGEPLRGHSGRVQHVAFSPDGCLIASASPDGTVLLWNMRTGGPIGEPLQVGDWANSVAFSPDDNSLACGCDNGTILIWEMSNKAMAIKMTLQGHSDSVRSVTFSPDGQYIASGSRDGTVRIWDAQTGEPWGRPLEGHRDWVRCVAYSPDGCLIASSSDDRTVRIWDARTGLPVGEPLQGHSSWVLSVAFSPDGCSLASAGADMKTYVYSIPNANTPLDDLETRWLTCCSRMDEHDGWVKDGETLLLWVPVSCRTAIKVGARFIISNSVPRVGALSVEYRTLFRYSGRDWVKILGNL